MYSTLDISPIILAAGQSKRFGSDKLLATFEYNGHVAPLFIHTLQCWLAVFPHVTLVVRPDNNDLLSQLDASDIRDRVTVVSSKQAHLGMSASLIAGIQQHQHASAWLIGLADMPFVSTQVLQTSLDELSNGAIITRPYFNNQPGHPVGFCHRFYDELMSLSGDKGAKQLLATHDELVKKIHSDTEGILLDIDTPLSLANFVVKSPAATLSTSYDV
jgi:molybdenum cofactor cytidylyltransferase